MIDKDRVMMCQKEIRRLGTAVREYNAIIEDTRNIDYEKLFETWADFDDAEAADEVNQLIEVKELGEIDALSFIAFCYGYEEAMKTIRGKA
jgi:hypothetical protein